MKNTCLCYFLYQMLRCGQNGSNFVSGDTPLASPRPHKRIQAPSFHTAQFTRSKDCLTRAIPEPFFARPMVTASRLQCYGVILCSGKVAFGLDANQELSKHIYEA